MHDEHNVVTEKISILKYITDIYEITVLLIAKAGPPSTDIRFIKNLGWRKGANLFENKTQKQQLHHAPSNS